jgi:hypothetical protein
MRGAFKVLLGAVMLGGVLFGADAGLAANVPAGGSVHLFATPEDNSALHTTVLFTGAIGDHGQALTINKDGKADATGDYVKVTLAKGSFEINSTALNAKFATANPTVNKATCSAQFSGTGPVSLFDGSGLYTGISGKLAITETFAVIVPRFTSGKSKGQCNLGNSARPVAQYSSITGTGAVKFS